MKTPLRKSILAAVLIALLCVPAYSASCLASEESGAYQRVDELLLKGENQQAWELLNDISVATGADNEKILWRKARTRYEMGRIADSDDMALMYFQEAEGNARAAIAEAPEQSAGYKWLAIALGAQSKYIDTKAQVQQSREVKTNIEKAIALAPDDDIALLVLSRWHYKISGLGFFARTFANIVYGELPEASLMEAENLLLQAIALHDRIAHRYNLAKVYDRMGRRDDAKRQYQQALILSVTFPEEAEEQEKAGKRLQRWD